MNKIAYTLLGIAGLAVAVGGGYWTGTQKSAGSGAATEKTTVASGKKILYYRNPMGLPDTSPVPKKDQMGMDYIPVYEGEEPESKSGIKVSTEKIQKLGVKTEAAQLREFTQAIRAVGRIEVDERRLHTIAPKFEGYIERLHVNAVGQSVGKGQPLMEVYSPDLVSAQREYAIASQGLKSLKNAGGEAQVSMKELMEASLVRLSNWDISPTQLERLQKEGARRTLTLSAPASGVVMERKAVAGMRFMPGEILYQIADVSSVWVIAELYEQDIGQVKAGQEVKVKVNAYPDREFAGKVAFVYPTLNPQTRTGQVRVELNNREGLLKPAMYASLELVTSPVKTRVVTVPDSAVLHTGTREVVIVQVGEGRFEPRPVKLGMKGDGHVQVLDGVGEGEQVVVSANFLIDAESNLKAALAGFTPGQGVSAPKPESGHRTQGKVERVELKDGSATITHEPIPALNWPAMTMTFKADEATLKQLKAGDTIQFEFAEKGTGNWTLLKILPAAADHSQHKH